MAEHRTAADTPVKSEKQELDQKGKLERGNDERLGQKDDGSSNHPVTKKTGIKSESNAGEDQTSGDG
jgi:hypothetical protein